MVSELLGKGLLLVVKLDAVREGRINRCFKDFFDPFDDVLAVLSRIDNPTDILLEGLKVAFRFIKAALTIYYENLFDNSQNVKQ
jgi:hypothetical protein